MKIRAMVRAALQEICLGCARGLNQSKTPNSASTVTFITLVPAWLIVMAFTTIYTIDNEWCCAVRMGVRR
jgi:ABC-type transporter Mla maintaining outer membrane lipid asymmetry permease subunit MlaE